MQVEFTTELTGREAPKEFRLLRFGRNATTKGDIVLTEASAAAVVDKVRADGRDQNRLSFDFNHAQMRAVTAEEGKSAGWFSVEVRTDGLWVVNAEWTETALSAIQKREYRFFSPVLYLDAKTREPSQLVNVALTNLPATKNQTPLVASQTTGNVGEPKESTLDENVVKLFGALGVPDAAAAEAKFVALTAENKALIDASKQVGAELSQVKATLAARDEADAVAKRDGLIAELSEAGKLEPALHDWAKTQSIESLTAYGAGRPASTAVSTPPVTAPSESVVALSAVELDVCSQMGLSPEEFQAHKKGTK